LWNKDYQDFGKFNSLRSNSIFILVLSLFISQKTKFDNVLLNK